MADTKKILDYLFVSKVRIKSLKYFYFHQDAPIHLRAASRELDEEINAVRREFLRLVEIKMLRVEVRGNRKYFSLNLEFPFHEELHTILIKSFGIGKDIIKHQAKLGKVTFAVLTSHYLNGYKMDPQDIDLVLVGEINMNIINDIVHKAEIYLKREVNYTILGASEFNLRKKRKDQFISKLIMDTRVVLIGSREEFIY